MVYQGIPQCVITKRVQEPPKRANSTFPNEPPASRGSSYTGILVFGLTTLAPGRLGYPMVNVCEYTIPAGARAAGFVCPSSPAE